MDNDTSDSASSISDGGLSRIHTVRTTRSARQSKPTKRKTYDVRRDEIRSLRAQLEQLQAKLSEYQNVMPMNSSGLRDALVANALLARAAEQSTLALATNESMMSAYTLNMIRATGVVPLHDVIHLPVDADQRQAVLAGLYEWKLRSAAKFMAERTRFLDLSAPHRRCEQFETPAGAVTLDVTPFTRGHSLRQVYDAYMRFVVNQEISLSEQLGFLTIRESDELEDFTYGQSRFLSSVPGGLDVESNVVTFATCVDATTDTPGFAIAAVDFVEQDDLHPYRPRVYGRKELVGATTFHEIASPTRGGKPIIAMVRWSYVRVLPPEVPISEEANGAVRDSISEWCAYVPMTIKEQLAATPPLVLL